MGFLYIAHPLFVAQVYFFDRDSRRKLMSLVHSYPLCPFPSRVRGVRRGDPATVGFSHISFSWLGFLFVYCLYLLLDIIFLIVFHALSVAFLDSPPSSLALHSLYHLPFHCVLAHLPKMKAHRLATSFNLHFFFFFFWSPLFNPCRASMQFSLGFTHSTYTTKHQKSMDVRIFTWNPSWPLT